MKSNDRFFLGVVSGVIGRRRRPAPRRFGGAIKLNPDKYKRYRELHDEVWDDVLLRMSRSNIRNFTIYYHKETSTLFSHFEWIGHLNHGLEFTSEEEKVFFDADMHEIAADPIVRKWWQECEPCQEPFSQWKHGSLPLSQGGDGDWWANLECLTHCGHWPVKFSNELRDPDFVKLD